ncbi:MAG: 4-hydroxythreonine-4-phosphate dehydrogenase, partial [Alphaproteobacteria bacterium]|nr:4-hydroxythreonine-4-phosphate dehydrogenase [Alphaproteobacteria bacterium]
MTTTAPLAVTMGEPAGIGGELSLKAWSKRRQGDRPFF